MLTPSQMDDAGGEVAAVYRQIEAELLDYLVLKMIEGDVSDPQSQAAIVLLTRDMPLELKRAIDAHAPEIDAAVRHDVERALLASDAFDLAIISEYLGMELSADALSAQARAVAAGIRGIIARDNLEMTAAARTKFLQWSSWAAAQVGTGAMTPSRALHKAVRELAHGGISIASVTYRNEETGEVTVTNRTDVAVQRHVRSLIAQGASELTMERMREAGVEFVEVSSHIGARPSHAEWHGRVYHLGGAIDLDGTHYEDFHEGTGYQGLRGPYTDLGDQLLGVNCRHSFGPWAPGCPHAYDPNPEHPSGLSNDEVYDLTQKQRQRERDIRDTKRELAAAQRSYDADPSIENQVEVAKLKAKLRNQQEGMRKFIDEANARGNPGTEVLKRQPQREWAGDMPKARNDAPAPSNRTLDEFMAMPSTQRAYKAAGLTKAEARDALRAEIGAGKGERDNFGMRTRAQQREAFRNALARNSGAKQPPVEWENDAVAAIEDETTMAKYLRSTHGIEPSDEFSALPLERQKAVVAGMEDTRAKYGSEINVRHIGALEKTSRDEGHYIAATGKVLVHPTRGDGYVIGAHEAAHARDAAVSEKMPRFAETPDRMAYNLHSAEVLADARRSLGLRVNSRKYRDMLTQIFGNSPTLYRRHKDNPGEIVAYAVDYEASGRRNPLSQAIVERFGK